ncbi:MAG: tRNA pseudouridine(38-40) synthase TruA [Desulfovibrionaceae bacterium]
MARLKLIVAYQGTRFHGWQVQACAPGEEPRTVQGKLEKAFGVILGAPVRVHGSGRTDAGVHADGQVAHVDVPDARADMDWRRALNANLPRSIVVVEASRAADDFHAQNLAREKIYTYNLWLTRDFVLPKRRHFVWAVGPLDTAAMEAAAALLTGRHDFAAFRNMGTEVQTTVRTVHGIWREPTGYPAAPGLEEVWFFRADGFLKQMVRNLMGCLVAVGRGKLAPDAVAGILASCDRSLAPPTAPPQGLTLKQVFY